MIENILQKIEMILGVVDIVDWESNLPQIRVKVDTKKPLKHGIKVCLESFNDDLFLLVQY